MWGARGGFGRQNGSGACAVIYGRAEVVEWGGEESAIVAAVSLAYSS